MRVGGAQKGEVCQREGSAAPHLEVWVAVVHVQVNDVLQRALLSHKLQRQHVLLEALKLLVRRRERIVQLLLRVHTGRVVARPHLPGARLVCHACATATGEVDGQLGLIERQQSNDKLCQEVKNRVLPSTSESR